MSEIRVLTSVSEIIEALGGPRQCSHLFGGVPTRFSNWGTSDRFPDSMHMRIYCECMKRGLHIAPELVGMTPEVMALARGSKQHSLPLSVA